MHVRVHTHVCFSIHQLKHTEILLFVAIMNSVELNMRMQMCVLYI